MSFEFWVSRFELKNSEKRMIRASGLASEPETQNSKPETDSYRPFQFAGRFSTNALDPSLASSVCITMLCKSDS